MSNLMHKVRVAARLLLSADVRRIAKKERKTPRRLAAAPVARIETQDPENGLIQASIGSHRLWLPARTKINDLGELYQEVFDSNHPHFYEYAECVLKPGDTVVDAGACEGFFTRFALDRGARVIAVEPWAPMARALRKTFADEMAQDRFKVVEAALSHEQGRVTLHFNPEEPWGASLIDQSCHLDEANVRKMTLDELIITSGWDRCDFVKADVEGFEHEMFRGAVGVLKKWKPRLSVAVYHEPAGFLKLRDFVHSLDLGYQIEGKGIKRRSGIGYPMLLHAW